MQKTDKTERAELYKERSTQAFISKFLSGEINELDPVYDPKLGYRYPLVESLIEDASSARDFLEKLYEAGVLERKLYDKIIYCPKCGSANISMHYTCPYCGSFNVLKSALIEHVKCGYMDVEDNFRKANKLVCPKCHEDLKKVDMDYRKAGIWCTCKECGKSFDIPVPKHFCRNCHTNFTFEDALIRDVYSYTLKEEVREEASSGLVFITPVRDFLQENGFEVESPAFLKGKSGANHQFDIAAHRGETAQKVTVIDFATSSEGFVPEQPVIALFAKIYDVSPDSAYLIVIPKISDNGRKMAELYDIRLIEAKNQKEAIKTLGAAMLRK
jgi:transcription elongation factor Elf1